VIQDEEGNILSLDYLMDLGSQSLHDIEGAVEDWRQKVLPDMEADLLDKAQSQFTQGQKSELTCNGTSPYSLRPYMENSIQLQKYQVDGIGVSYFELTQQLAEGYISPRLQELSAY